MENNTRVVAEHKLDTAYALLVFVYNENKDIVAYRVGTQATALDEFVLHREIFPRHGINSWDFAKALSIFLDFIKDSNPTQLQLQSSLLTIMQEIAAHAEASLKRKIINSLS